MTRDLRLLDLFCGAGGCAAGYVRAGFEVHGVDHREQPRYLRSRASSFTLADALDYLAEHGPEFDVIHASPPCQAYSRCRNMTWITADYPDLLAPTLASIATVGRPFIVENVIGAPFVRQYVIELCGTMFGLRTRRHRLFACSHLILAPGGGCMHRSGDLTIAGNRFGVIGQPVTAYSCADGSTRHRLRGASKAEAGKAMGIDWMTRQELSQAIPPAYTAFIGRQLRDHLAS